MLNQTKPRPITRVAEANPERFAALARRRAHSAGLSGAEAEDYVSSFITRCCSLPPELPAPFVFAAGRNAGTDFLRLRQRVRQNEQGWAEGTDASDHAAAVPLPETEAVRREIVCRIQIALTQLSPDQRQLLYLLVVEEKTAPEAAAETGRTAQAIRQSFCNLTRRLRGILEEEGFTETEACQYLALLGRGKTR